MADDQLVDEHLAAVLDEVLDAVYQAKQAAWSASSSAARGDLADLVSFLIDQSGRFMIAEERIDGRADAVSSPSSHQRGNLMAEARGDLATALSLLAQRLDAIVVDVRARAAQIPDASEVSMLRDLANGLETRLCRLRPS